MDIKISVTGLGYVGLPLAIAFSKSFNVIGYDHNKLRIEQLQQGIDITGEIESISDLHNSQISFTTNPEDLKKTQFHIIAVPTPVNRAKQPDLKALFSATETLAKQLKVGDIVVYESTVYPGATEEDCVPILENISGLICSKDFHIGYSPERINPGDKTRRLNSIVKIISAQDKKTLDVIEYVYSKIIHAGLYRAPNIKTAEAAKIIENVQRDLNVALLNEVAMIFNRMQIDTHEVLKAASTKWNFLSFKPGLVGGHCIGVDPYYLTYKAQCYGYHPEVILAGRRVNDDIGKYVAEQTIRQLVQNGTNIKEAKILILGIGFKEDCPDIRNSRVKDLHHELCDFGMNVYVHDPVANPEEVKEKFNIQLTALADLPTMDAIVLAVAHHHYRVFSVDQYEKLLKPKAVIMDVKGILDAEHFRKNGYRLWRL
ncbi:MAG TPA: nucleotide sugar dehydrogenase [Gammaproteobacteria bacterium]|nr:nucleotide sugar dehydrogenase [Gammaproteobacteria bacterium]